MREHNLTALSGPVRSEVLIKISIAVAVCLNSKTNWKSAHRLTAQMRDRHVRGISDWTTRFPYAMTEINLLIMVEESFIEAAQLPEKIASQQYATAGLPIDLALPIPIPAYVLVREKSPPETPERPEAECR